ncbi:DoxX family membrane protein [Achromobacter ruhlandii]|uniref:DoxX family membrane protein n=1 Tax=Achromobacter ruhlandii TaxID=72557 RepID=UPI0020162587|nr:DoxX family membrane protein [Achromobacter ruhlandii]
MAHFGLAPGPLFAVLVIALELAASAMILSGRLRWLGVLATVVLLPSPPALSLMTWLWAGTCSRL